MKGIREEEGWASGSVWAVRTCLPSAVFGAGGCAWAERAEVTAPLAPPKSLRAPRVLKAPSSDKAECWMLYLAC